MALSVETAGRSPLPCGTGPETPAKHDNLMNIATACGYHDNRGEEKKNALLFPEDHSSLSYRINNHGIIFLLRIMNKPKEMY